MVDPPSVSLLGILDWVVVAVYAGGLLFLGVALSRRRLKPVDYFLASRNTKWPTLGLALLASNMSSTALVGLAGGAYAVGISVYDYEWSAVVILLFFCVFLLPSIIRNQTYTMPEFLERRYDARMRLGFALLSLFLIIFVDSAAVLYSGALVCQLLFPDWPLWFIVALLAGTAGLYTTLGGLRAVIYTEAVQAVVLLVGALLICISAFRHAGGWRHVMQTVDPAALSLLRPLGDPGVPWPGLLLGIPLLGFYYWCTNQSIVQRMLSAKNLDHARWGAMFAGLLKLPVLFLIVLPGTCALLLFPDLKRPDLVYPNLILHLLPPGLVGLVVAAFIAATMVSIASILNSASTLLTMDVIRQLKPSLSDSQVVRIGRFSTMGLLFVAVAWAPQLHIFPSLWQYLQAVLAYAVPPVVALFLAGMFWRRATANGAAATMLWGSLLGAAVFVCNALLGVTHFHFLYAAPFLTAADLLILAFVSLRDRAHPVSDVVSMWALEFSREERLRLRQVPWWQDYRLHGCLLLALTAAVVIAFR